MKGSRRGICPRCKRNVQLFKSHVNPNFKRLCGDCITPAAIEGLSARKT